MSHRHHVCFDTGLQRWRCTICGVACRRPWRSTLPTLPIRWRTLGTGVGLGGLLLVAGLTRAPRLVLVPALLLTHAGSLVAGYLLRRWHRPSGGLTYTTDEKTALETLVLFEQFLRSVVLQPLGAAPLLTTPRRVVAWPVLPTRAWQRLLRRMGSSVAE